MKKQGAKVKICHSCEKGSSVKGRYEEKSKTCVSVKALTKRISPFFFGTVPKNWTVCRRKAGSVTDGTDTDRNSSKVQFNLFIFTVL